MAEQSNIADFDSGNAINPVIKQFADYYKVLREYAPKTIDEFIEIKYNKANKEQWETLKSQYQILDRYDAPDSVSAETILALDNAAMGTKQKGFAVEVGSNSNNRRKIKKLSTFGNVATVDFNGEVLFSHSKSNSISDLATLSYSGDFPLILAPKNPVFTPLEVDGYLRNVDTEYKLLEHIASQITPDYSGTINLLTEKCMCDSCKNIVKQFRAKYPKATLNVIQGKNHNNGEKAIDKNLKITK